MSALKLSGNIVDVLQRRIFPGTVVIEDRRIRAIRRDIGQRDSHYILPGFVDAHVHLESSLMLPTEFARLATVHGTVAVVSDPHEIANVLGLAGVRFMLANAARTPLNMAFGAPSCVPATPFESAGAKLSVEDIRQLFEHDHLTYLSEMMNVTGVLSGEPDVMAKIRLAQQLGYPVDGHAPDLYGSAAQHYAHAGITTDHECSTLQEAHDKLAAGMKILIREGSAAKNYQALHPLIDSHAEQCMLCSDDKHPDDLTRGHINTLVRRSVELGHDVMDVLRLACVNPVLHYNLPVGLLRPGDMADCIVVDDLRTFTVLQTYCQGQLVAAAGQGLLPAVAATPINYFRATPKRLEDFRLPAEGRIARLIVALDGQLLTSERHVAAPISNGYVMPCVQRDILKLVVVNRYADTPPAVALIHNFGLKRGALASSVAHDSHNVVAVGTTDAEICTAVNAVIHHQGGIAVAEGHAVDILPLPIAGLMSTADGDTVASRYARLDAKAKRLGTTLTAPFMTLSFMALLVIPTLKLSDRGLFSATEGGFVSPWIS
jgi:adenine deaminase